MRDQIWRELQRLEGKVETKMFGRVENERIPGILAETNCVVLPSIYPENQSCTVLEAFAAGVPVIASSAGGNPELVTNGERGLIFESGSSEDLARRILEFRRLSVEQRTAMSQSCIEFARRHSYAVAASRYLESFERATPLQVALKPDARNVWIDVSSFLFHDRIVGLTRPIMELAKRRAMLPGNFRFYCYSNGRAREVSEIEIAERLLVYSDTQGEHRFSNAKRHRHEPRFDKNSVTLDRARLVQAIKELVHLVPIAERAARWVVRFLRAVARLIRKLQVRRSAGQAIEGLESDLPFKDGDAVLLLAYEPSIHLFLKHDFSRLDLISYLHDLIPVDLPFL